jgi:hypothetical protein
MNKSQFRLGCISSRSRENFFESFLSKERPLRVSTERSYLKYVRKRSGIIIKKDKITLKPYKKVLNEPSGLMIIGNKEPIKLSAPLIPASNQKLLRNRINSACKITKKVHTPIKLQLPHFIEDSLSETESNYILDSKLKYNQF